MHTLEIARRNDPCLRSHPPSRSQQRQTSQNPLGIHVPYSILSSKRSCPFSVISQVQYADKAAARGSPVVALSNGRDWCAIVAERRRASPLEDFVTTEKVCITQDGLFVAFAGLAADGRLLIDKARVFCENFRLTNAEAVTARSLAEYIAGQSSLP
jgi:20S proteasome alpha/beta subunit